MRSIHPSASLSRDIGKAHKAALPLLTTAFLVGAFLGTLLVGCASGAGGTALSGYIEGFAAALRTGGLGAPSVLAACWSVLRWPLLVLALSYVRFGLIGIPLVLCARGFLFSFCIAAFVQVLGRSGLLFALLLLGVESFLSIPVLFILAAQALQRASVPKPIGKSRPAQAVEQSPFVLLRNTLCFSILLFCILWESLLLPLLLSGVTRFFTA